jgi:hypothetical protein
MPIKKENRHLYPSNWKQIREEVRERAADMCEKCGVLNHSLIIRAFYYGEACYRYVGQDGAILSTNVLRASDGKIWSIIPWDAFAIRNEAKPVKVVCTVAHLDHDPTNNDLDNLRFWCQKCHNSYDAPHRAETRKLAKLHP